MTGKVKN